MVRITIENSIAVFAVQGLHRLWAFKARLEFPLAHIIDVRRADPAIARAWWKGIHLPGTHLPGVLAAGTFHDGGKRTFWDVRDPSRTIAVELTGEPYDLLLVEVEDPQAEISRFQAAPLT